MTTTEMIKLLGNLFYVSLGLAVLGLALAVFFFFYFDIRTVRALMTGSAKRKAIERMNEQNSRTGKLRTSITDSIDAKSKPVIQNPSQVPTADISPAPVTYAAPAEPAVQETTILRSSEPEMETTLLNAEPEAGETSILGGCPPQPAVRFELTENTVVIHTNEFI